MIQHADRAWPKTAQATRRPTILVVDDNEHDREIYGRMLCYNGFDVVFAGSAAAAMRLAPEREIDLVLLDLGLPDLPGLTLLRNLRKLPGLERTPAIALSAFSRRDRGEEARRAGCVEYIEKPAAPVTVLHSVEHRVGRPPLPGVGRPPCAIETG